MQKIESFDDWWKMFCKKSSWNQEFLSFADVTKLKDTLEMAFNRELPEDYE
jgi:hypothetical protein